MKGNTLGEFMDDLLTMGGPEKEFAFNGKMYMLETYYDHDNQLYEMVVFECNDSDEPYIFRCKKHSLSECVEAFEHAAIFGGKTIYEAEREIEVLFG